MILYLRMAWRNIWRHRRRTVIVVAAMAFCMALLTLYDGVVAGFEEAIYGNAIKLLGGNIQVRGEGYGEKSSDNPMVPVDDYQSVVEVANRQENVINALPRINTGGLTTNREGAFPVNIIGFDPILEAKTNVVAENIVEGRFLTPEDEDVILIGRGLAVPMGIGIGDRITLSGNMANEQTRQRTMTVVGIYDIGFPSVEKRTMYMSLNEAQNLYNLRGQVTDVVILVENVGQEAPVVQALTASFPRHEIETWETSIPELSSTLGMKNTVMTTFGFIIVGIASIGILNILLMAVFERTREIGLLGAMGVKPRQITILFLLEGMMIGLVGAAAGAVLGFASNSALGVVGIDYSMFAEMTDYMALLGGIIYPVLPPEWLVIRALTVLLVSVVASIYPAREAARREPAEALHYV